MLPEWGHLGAADRPPKPATGDEHHPNTRVDDGLQRLGDAVLARVAERLEASARR